MRRASSQTGASGSGKTTLTEYIVNRYGFKRAKTCTTRLPRSEETLDAYNFMDKSEFEQRKSEMVEYTELFGHYYGSQISSFEVGQKLIVTLNHTGSRALQDIHPNRAIPIMMRVSQTNMIKRITQRSQVSDSELASRLNEFEVLNSMSAHEIADTFKYVVDANQSLESVAQQFDEIMRLIGCSHHGCGCC